MTIVFEFVVDIICSVIVDVTYEASFSHKVPLWIRILLLFVLTAFFGTILLGVMCIGILLLKDKQILNGLLMTALGFGLTIGIIRKLITTYKARELS